MIAVRTLKRRSKSGVAGRVVDVLSSCLPALSSSLAPTKKRLRPSDDGQLTLSCARSAEMLALNYRVARSLDLDQITAWQAELEVLHRDESGCITSSWCSQLLTSSNYSIVTPPLSLLRKALLLCCTLWLKVSMSATFSEAIKPSESK